jgi:hypothetical protein
MIMIQQPFNEGLAREILKNYLLSCFEPNPINFSRVTESEVERVSRAITIANGIIAARFNAGPVNRNSFLAACLDATCEESIEHLIVGYGIKYGNTTKVEALHHVTGDKHSVMPTLKMAESINRQVTQTRKGEVLIFHNHPAWFLNALMDNVPLASSTDRVTATNIKFHWFQLLKTFFGTGDVKLYIGENEFVKEFVLPPFDLLIDLYRKTTTPQTQYSAITN